MFKATYQATPDRSGLVALIMMDNEIAMKNKSLEFDAKLINLSHYGLIRIVGEDAQTFLQNQLTCDLREINQQKAQHGSYCTPQGRVLVSFLLWQQDNDYFMQIPASLLASIKKRLSLYVLRAKVQLIDATDTSVRIGLTGSDAARAIQQITGLNFESNHHLQVRQNEKLCAISLSGYHIELITSTDDAPRLIDNLRQHAKPADINFWNWLNIQSAFPMILPETQEMFLPQMINLDAMGGISFKKGCYPGQEIVARTHYLGKLKRRMYLARIATIDTIKPGDLLYSHDMNDQSCGNIVNIASSPNGDFDVLAVIQQSSVETCPIHWQSPQGPTLQIKPLPYSLTD